MKLLLLAAWTSVVLFLLQFQPAVHSQSFPFFLIEHMRAHSQLPTRPTVCSTQEHQDHALHRQSTSALRLQFHIPREAAHAIIRDCLAHSTSFYPLPMGVNPQGLHSSDLRQVDVTHFPSFERVWIFYPKC